jgi:hypothetical protein
MLFDLENLFSDRQAVTTTGNSANLIDTGAARDLLAGEALTLLVVVSEGFSGTWSESPGGGHPPMADTLCRCPLPDEIR